MRAGPRIRGESLASGFGVTTAEALDATLGINQLLLAGVEGMASRADIDAVATCGGSGLNNLTASAADVRLFRIGMNSVAHGNLRLWAAIRKAGLGERQAKTAYSALPG